MAGEDELLALCTAVGEHEGTFLEGIVPGCLDKFSDDEIELLAKMTAAAKRSINWNLLTIDPREPDRVPRQLQASARARELGGRVDGADDAGAGADEHEPAELLRAVADSRAGTTSCSCPVPERIEQLRDPAVRGSRCSSG